MHTKKDLLENLKGIIDESENKKEEAYESLMQWIRNFILSGIDESDRMDILRYGKPAFSNLKELADSDVMITFFNLIDENRILDGARFTGYMAYELPEKREYVKQLVRQRDIYLLSPKLEMTMGGLGHTVRHRANFLTNLGYRVTILNAGNLKNYDYILNHYQSTGQMDENVNFYNYIKYYQDKNSNGKSNPTLDDIISENDTQTTLDDFHIKKTLNDDYSITMDYYLDDDNVKTELFIEKCMVYRKEGRKESYYTADGFKFYEADPKAKRFTLYERESGMELAFKYKNEFLNHFISEVCLNDEKPFIICDSTRQWYNMNGIRLKDAFKIGALHGNPFVDFDPQKGFHPHVNHFKRIESFDKVVLLTKSVYDEVVEAGIDEKYLTIIPNYVLDESLEYGEVEKDKNKIGIFSRVAKTKQISHMIQAFETICHEHEDAYLEIYGEATDPSDIEELEELKSQIEELNLQDKIQFKGYIEDVASEMKKSIFSLLTSKEEGFSLATLELMANSTPMISYDIRYGPSDLITDGVDGILIEKDDIDQLASSMSDLLDNPEKTIEMGKAAKEKIKSNFSISAVCPMWEELFVDIFIEDELRDEIKRLKLEDDNKKLSKDLSKVKKENRNLKKDNEKLKKSNEELNKFKNEVLSSRSWKLTRPLRRK